MEEAASALDLDGRQGRGGQAKGGISDVAQGIRQGGVARSAVWSGEAGRQEG